MPVELTSVTEVREWRAGIFDKVAQTRQSSKHSQMSKNACFSIVYDTRDYNLVAPDEQTAQFWVTTLNHLLSLVQAVQQENGYFM